MASIDIEHGSKLDVASVLQRKSKTMIRTTSLPAFLAKQVESRCFSTDGVRGGPAEFPVIRTTPVVGAGAKPSRYREDFVELGRLGSGGFGIVCKAENKLDSTVYAMKKISFRSRNSVSLEKVLREVKALARLDHPNVVRYYQAWLEEEYVDPLSHFRNHVTNGKHYASDDGTFHSNNTKKFQDDSAEDLSDDPESEFNSPPGEQIWNFHMRDMFSKIGPSKLSESPSDGGLDLSVEFEKGDEEDSGSNSSHSNDIPFDMDPLERSDNGCEWNSLRKKIQQSYQPKKSITLYIQMQLCEDNLQNWMESRASVDKMACIAIFRQICKGLKYIHNEGIIHRDLKPSNIFLLNKEQIRESRHLTEQELTASPGPSEAKWVVIGDFGLAVYRQQEPSSPGVGSLSSSAELAPSLSSGSLSVSEHTIGVGTMVYASPEQIQQESYDEKTDIYSLGIILFEMLYLARTKMERAHVLSNLRKNIIPSDFLTTYPKESAFILWLLAPSPSERPSAAQILKHEIFRSESISVRRASFEKMQERMKQQEQLIEEQRRQIEDLQKLVMQLVAEK